MTEQEIAALGDAARQVLAALPEPVRMFSARLPHTLHARLVAHARKTGESMNTVLCVMARDGLDKAESAPNG